MPNISHVPTEETRRQVASLTVAGIPEDQQARILRIDPKTLRKHYHEELDISSKVATAQVAGFLFQNAKNGNVAAQIFWLKVRGGDVWREQPVGVKFESPLKVQAAVAVLDPATMDDDALARAFRAAIADTAAAAAAAGAAAAIASTALSTTDGDLGEAGGNTV